MSCLFRSSPRLSPSKRSSAVGLVCCPASGANLPALTTFSRPRILPLSRVRLRCLTAVAEQRLLASYCRYTQFRSGDPQTGWSRGLWSLSLSRDICRLLMNRQRGRHGKAEASSKTLVMCEVRSESWCGNDDPPSPTNRSCGIERKGEWNERVIKATPITLLIPRQSDG